MPKTVEVKGLTKGIEILVSQLEDNGKIKVQFVSETIEADFDKARCLLVYRIVQELSNNTIKHSGASMIKMSLEEYKGKLILQYLDNGKGFSVDKIESRETKSGLRNICSRLELLGATYELTTTPGEGTHYKIGIPLQSMKLKNDNGTNQLNYCG